MNYAIFLMVLTSYLQAESIEHWTRTMADVAHTVQADGYFQPSLKPAMIKALDAFVQQVDEHSHFLGPEDYKHLMATTRGNFFGIGVELGPKKPDDEYVMILNVKRGSPAEKAGMQRYDKIIGIDGSPVESLSTEECVRKLKGDTQHSEVILDILRDKKGALSLTLKRDVLPEEDVWCCYLPEPKIFYCALSLCTHEGARTLKKALESGLTKKPEGIILDLRDNAGGAVKAAVDCAALFLPRGSLVVSTKDRHGKVLAECKTESHPLIKGTIPVVVLVNTYTVSAAEILAQVLAYYSAQGTIAPRIIIAGTKTHGKGSVQEIRPVGRDCALKLTTALYYLPDNSSLQMNGIVPDFVIKQTYPPTKEIKLLHKLYGKERGTKKKAPDKEARKLKTGRSAKLTALKNDHQVQCACHLITLLKTAQTICPEEVQSPQKRKAWLKKHFIASQKLVPEELS